MKLTSAAMAPMFVACWFGLAGYPYELRLKVARGSSSHSRSWLARPV